jgi:hypothetical protein
MRRDQIWDRSSVFFCEILEIHFEILRPHDPPLVFWRGSRTLWPGVFDRSPERRQLDHCSNLASILGLSYGRSVHSKLLSLLVLRLTNYFCDKFKYKSQYKHRKRKS